MVGQAARLIAHAVLACALAGAAGGLAAQQLIVTGSCRDQLPHGAFELRMPEGLLRVSGAFNRGQRTGTFLFWTSTGVRVALLPFERDVLDGTVALWYIPAARKDARGDTKDEPKRKLEAAYVKGRLSGMKRSWFPNGNTRAEFRYVNGTLVEARAFSESGAPLPESEARSVATRDAELDATYYETLAGIIRTNHPAC